MKELPKSGTGSSMPAVVPVLDPVPLPGTPLTIGTTPSVTPASTLQPANVHCPGGT